MALMGSVTSAMMTTSKWFVLVYSPFISEEILSHLQFIFGVLLLLPISLSIVAAIKVQGNNPMCIISATSQDTTHSWTIFILVNVVHAAACVAIVGLAILVITLLDSSRTSSGRHLTQSDVSTKVRLLTLGFVNLVKIICMALVFYMNVFIIGHQLTKLKWILLILLDLNGICDPFIFTLSCVIMKTYHKFARKWKSYSIFLLHDGGYTTMPHVMKSWLLYRGYNLRWMMFDNHTVTLSFIARLLCNIDFVIVAELLRCYHLEGFHTSNSIS